ncbi:polyprenyl synthetase family protein [Lentzea xinjiangensis]|nr:polyprenyl synthetase family protein [Lentzea xinjiangensis]
MTSIDVTAPPRDVPERTRAAVEPPLRAVLAGLPDSTREVAEYGLAGHDLTTAALTLLCAEAIGDAADAVRVAVALELAHLHEHLHADLMARAVSRNHRPSAWVEFGDERAVGTAEELLSLAFTLLTKPEVVALNTALLSVVDGYVQELDMDERDDVDLAEHLGVAAAKHSALTATACELGALAAGATRAQADDFREFGDDIGLARKHVDDVLAIWGGAVVSGRPLYDDLAHRRRTLPVAAAINAGTDVYAGDASPRERAALVERAGGRRWCEQQAELLLARALGHLRRAAPGAADELAGFARSVTTARCAPQPVLQPAVQPVPQLVSRSAAQPVPQSATQLATQQLVPQPATQPVPQPVVPAQPKAEPQTELTLF